MATKDFNLYEQLDEELLFYDIPRLEIIKIIKELAIKHDEQLKKIPNSSKHLENYYENLQLKEIASVFIRDLEDKLDIVETKYRDELCAKKKLEQKEQQRAKKEIEKQKKLQNISKKSDALNAKTK